MNQNQTRWTLMALGWLAATVAAFWTWTSLTNAHQELENAAVSQRKCTELCNSIASAGVDSSTKSWMMPAEFRPGPRITEALSQAGVSIPKLYVSSSGGRSFQGTSFMELTVEMPDLTGVELSSVIRFLHSLASGERVFQMNRITLDAVDKTYPFNDGAPPLQLWNASIDVSYFVESGQRTSNRNR
jgi:hypothetical protein